MRNFWKIVIASACIGALYGIVQALLENLFGITIKDGWWDLLALVVIAIIVLSIWRPSVDSSQ